MIKSKKNIFLIVILILLLVLVMLIIGLNNHINLSTSKEKFEDLETVDQKINLVDCTTFPSLCYLGKANNVEYNPYVGLRASYINKLNEISTRYSPAEPSDSDKWVNQNKSVIPPRFKRK
jgi:hypothetical protein